MLKAVIASAGARDYYQLPLAFFESGLLQTLVTDLYFPADRVWFETSFARVLGRERVRKRFLDELDSRYVYVEPTALFYSLVAKFLRNGMVNALKDSRISFASRRLANKYGAALVSHSYYAYEAFKEGIDRPEFRFLVQLHPHPLSVRRILQEELERTPAARSSLMQEPDMKLSGHLLERLVQEPLLANGWIVASSFTKQTLVENGIPPSNINVVPYGVNTATFAPPPEAPSRNTPFTIIFVGSMVQRKGLSYLLEAVRLLKSHNVRLVLCGRGYVDYQLLHQYRDIDVEVHLNLTYFQLLEQLHKSHVFALPSLVEGFGHVIIEAMAAGVPPITTIHTGGVDIITDSYDGFVVPIRSSDAIAEKLVWALEHPHELSEMGKRAIKRAQQQTWERYRQQIVEAYRNMLHTAYLVE